MDVNVFLAYFKHIRTNGQQQFVSHIYSQALHVQTQVYIHLISHAHTEGKVWIQNFSYTSYLYKIGVNDPFQQNIPASHS